MHEKYDLKIKRIRFVSEIYGMKLTLNPTPNSVAYIKKVSGVISYI